MDLKDNELFCIKDHYSQDGTKMLEAGKVYTFEWNIDDGKDPDSFLWKYPLTVDTADLVTGAPARMVLTAREADCCVSHSTTAADLFAVHYFRHNFDIIHTEDGRVAFASEHGGLYLPRGTDLPDSVEELFHTFSNMFTRLHTMEEYPHSCSLRDYRRALAFLQDILDHGIEDPGGHFSAILNEHIYNIQEAAAMAKMEELGMNADNAIHEFLVGFLENGPDVDAGEQEEQER